MSAAITFRCPACNARIKAAAQLLGQERACPNCRRRLIVRPQSLRDNGPALVTDTWVEAAGDVGVRLRFKR